MTQSFAPGDSVEVIEGELKHLKGKVTRIDGNSVSLIADHKDLKEELEFLIREVRKIFREGDHVKV